MSFIPNGFSEYVNTKNRVRLFADEPNCKTYRPVNTAIAKPYVKGDSTKGVRMWQSPMMASHMYSNDLMLVDYYGTTWLMPKVVFEKTFVELKNDG